METITKINVAIVGGGASGLMLASSLPASLIKNGKTVLFERGERVGKKLSATGNGQGNITNLSVTAGGYFSHAREEASRALATVRAYDNTALEEFFSSLGVLLLSDGRGRVYPAGRQASALTDALRFHAEKQGCILRLQSLVTGIEKKKEGFLLAVQTPEGEEKYLAEYVVLCAGGKAAKNFGTDGRAYALAQAFGHTVTPLYPSLVQLKTDTAHTKTLKGIRVNDARVCAYVKNELLTEVRGDVIFTDYGVSGDAVFRASAYLADKLSLGVRLELDFLPDFTETQILDSLQKKSAAFPELPQTELLLGIVNNQVGRAVMRRAGGEKKTAAKLVKAFPLTVTGSLGFDYAQVTKGGIPLLETDEDLQSRFVQGLYFAGEILDVDGACGGYNLQWAFSSAKTVAAALAKKAEERGQV